MFLILILLSTNDSISVDTVQTYEIPEIVMFQNGISVVREVVPRYYEQSTGDVLTNLPMAALSYGFTGVNGVSFRGAKPYYTRIYLNGRQQRHNLTGYFNLAQLSLHSTEKITSGQSINGGGSSSLNFESKVNRYDRPYSFARFMFGSFENNIYGIDLTRAITNELGLYMSGEYHKTAGFREQADAQRLSVYANVYYNHFFPARFDIFYSDHDYGFPGMVNRPIEGRQKDMFLDASATVAFKHSVMNFFYNARNAEYADSQNVVYVDHRIKQVGADLSYHYDLFGIAVDYGVASYFLDVDGTVASYVDVPLDLWARLSKEYRRFSLKAAGYFGKAGDHENFYCPRLEASYDFFESTGFYVSLGRDARAPSDLEIHSMFDTLNPYFIVDGNKDLISEYCWIQEAGVRSNQVAIGFYRYDYDNFITVNPGPANYYEFVNIDSWLVTGCEACFDLPLRFYNTDSSITISVVVGGSGSVIIDGDSVPFTPQYQLGGQLSFTRETSRFGFGAAVRGEVYGRRIDISGQELSGFTVISAAGLVRFMGLSLVARINNLFDENYAYIPHYPMAPRNYDVSVKWEFWD